MAAAWFRILCRCGLFAIASAVAPRQPARWQGAQQLIWGNIECPSISGIQPGVELAACKGRCEQTVDCTAVNFRSASNECDLRRCKHVFKTGLVPPPVTFKAGWSGYAYQDIRDTPLVRNAINDVNLAKVAVGNVEAGARKDVSKAKTLFKSVGTAVKVAFAPKKDKQPWRLRDLFDTTTPVPAVALAATAAPAPNLWAAAPAITPATTPATTPAPTPTPAPSPSSVLSPSPSPPIPHGSTTVVAMHPPAPNAGQDMPVESKFTSDDKHQRPEQALGVRHDPWFPSWLTTMLWLSIPAAIGMGLVSVVYRNNFRSCRQDESRAANFAFNANEDEVVTTMDLRTDGGVDLEDSLGLLSSAME